MNKYHNSSSHNPTLESERTRHFQEKTLTKSPSLALQAIKAIKAIKTTACLACVIMLASCGKVNKKKQEAEILKKHNVKLPEKFIIDPGPAGSSVLPENAVPPDNYDEAAATQKPVFDADKPNDFVDS